MSSSLKQKNQFTKRPKRRDNAQPGLFAGKMMICLAVMFLILAQSAASQDVAGYFKTNCAACHWIGGGRLVGPDLQNVSQRGERDWQIRFILNPKAMLDAQDAYAMKLKEEAGGAIMTNVPGITREWAEVLLDFIDAESLLDSSQFKGIPTALPPFSDSIALAGWRLFTGETRLINTGPACMSCHSINADGSGLGGQLGPEMTGVFERLHGRTAITAWLSSPPTPTMRTVFKEHRIEAVEANQLAMFFESVDGRAGYKLDSTIYWVILILLCLAGSALGLSAFGALWGKRFRAVRRPLISDAKKQRLS